MLSRSAWHVLESIDSVKFCARTTYARETNRFSDSRVYEGFFSWFHVQAGTISLRVKAPKSRKKHIKPHR